jgi:molybdopterin-guanine dinucleotide biosynthesis protein MobB
MHLYHPHTLTICGYSGSGKTTLLEKLLKELSQHYQVGYIKYDAHKFEMDRPGKDTDKAWRAGACQISIADSRHHALIRRGQSPSWWPELHALECDLVLMEGHKFSPLPKMVVLDEAGEILKPDIFAQLEQVIAWIGPGETSPLTDSKRASQPYFCRDDVEGILQFVIEWFEQRLKAVPLYGLITAGSRGGDTALQLAQVRNSLRMLGKWCEKVFVSDRAVSTLGMEDQADLPVIEDWFPGFGAAGEVLSALHQYPNAAFLVAPRQLSRDDETRLQDLLHARQTSALSSRADETAEIESTALTIYEPRSYLALLMSAATAQRRDSLC